MYVRSGLGFAGMGAVDVLSLLDAAAAKYGLSPTLLRSVAYTESSYNPAAVSPAGALGVMQLMPATATQYGVSNPLDAAQNIDGGAHLLSDLLKRYNGDVSLALAAYNAGPGAVSKYGGVPPYAETQSYVQKILAAIGFGAPAADTAAPASDAGIWETDAGTAAPAAPDEEISGAAIAGFAVLGVVALWAVLS